MSAHTPGPWSVVPDPMRPLVADRRDGLVADLVEREDARATQANARLIAAAPDLLEALLRMRDEVREFLPNVCGEALAEAEAAIARARGTR